MTLHIKAAAYSVTETESLHYISLTMALTVFEPHAKTPLKTLTRTAARWREVLYYYIMLYINILYC